METTQVSFAEIPAPYGRACASCARAKVKCVTNSNRGAKCERCHRLNKDCQLSAATRIRKTIRKPPTKVDRLEEKLDGLVTLLKSSTGTASGPAPTIEEDGTISMESTSGAGATPTNPVQYQLTPPDSLMYSLETSPKDSEVGRPSYALTTSSRIVKMCPLSGPQIGNMSLNTPLTDLKTSYTASGTRSSASHSNTALSVRLEPSIEEAEEYLTIFKMHMMHYSPFMSIDAKTTARELRQERPFLWLCIMAISSKSTEQQKALGREFRLTVGREMLLEGKNNLDLLVGILTHVAWAHFHLYDKPIVTHLIQLAMGLVGNLGLRKLPPKDPPQLMLNFDPRGSPKPPTRTMEERRAGLWCWLVSSTMASSFQRLEPLRWTPYFDECLRMLAETRENSADKLLVQFVRLQLIVEKVAQAPWHDGPFDAFSSIETPSQFYMKALQSQLQDAKHAIPADLVDHNVLLMHTYSTEALVHEVAILKVPISSGGPDFKRLDSLYTCLRAVKNWFDAYLMPPPAAWLGTSMAVLSQMAHCIVALYRLSTLECPGWDCQMARDYANLSIILEQIVEKLAQVKPAVGLDSGTPEDKDIFSISSRTIDSIKVWWDSKLAAEATAIETTADENMAEAPIDFWDDAWLQDILGGGTYSFDTFTQ